MERIVDKKAKEFVKNYPEADPLKAYIYGYIDGYQKNFSEDTKRYIYQKIYQLENVCEDELL